MATKDLKSIDAQIEQIGASEMEGKYLTFFTDE